MTDSNATERICELLVERGIDYKLRRASATSARETVFWEYEKDGDWATAEYAVTVPQDGYGNLNASRFTPEQAVAATLGAEKPCPWCGRDMDKRSEADKDNAGHAWYRDDSDYIQGLLRSNEFMKKERAMLGSDDGSRWFELFGTPERAARTMLDLLTCRSCEKCQLGVDACSAITDIYNDEQEATAIEWLRGTND